jgi:hypothetical protein
MVTRSILVHPFFKTVNSEAVPQKRVTPPANPLTVEFLTVDRDAPGDADDLGRSPSIKNTQHEAVLEQPPHQPLTVTGGVLVISVICFVCLLAFFFGSQAFSSSIMVYW